MKIKIEQWDGQYDDACAMQNIAELCNPILGTMDRQNILHFYRGVTKGFAQSTLIAKLKNEICGYALLCPGASEHTVRLVGGVHPDHRSKGIATKLYTEILERIKQHPSKTEIQSGTLKSCPAGTLFLKKLGFTQVDQGHWSSRSVTAPFPSWAIEKVMQFEKASLTIVLGSEFETLRADWDREWWSLMMSANKDIPSTIPFQPIPFEIWRPRLNPPFLNRNHSLIALDELTPIGVLHLDDVVNGKINICYTGTASSHRRRGISTVLKIKSFELAKKLGAHTIGTFNHHKNPMLHINKRLGFEQQEVNLEYLKILK
ncbi:MAG: hypothetical protein CMK59_14320 [Proteobacteria bacterium]|nr:hypothetical protein [Pseudomonadota bacterium]